MAKNVSRQREPVGSTKPVCGACGDEIVQVNDRGTKACGNWKCGKRAQ